MARTDVGETTKLTLWRDKKQISATVKIGELKDQAVVAAAPKKSSLGLTVQDLTPQIAEGLGLKRAEGVVVTSVQPGSPAASAGIRRGDVILELNRKSVSKVDDFQNMLKQAKPETNLLFLLRRGDTNLFLALKSRGTQG